VLGGALAFTLAAPLAGLLAVRWLGGVMGFRHSALLVTAAVVIGTALLGYLLWRLILGPVTALSDRAEALGRGDRMALLEPLRHYGTREMGELGARVLEMAAQLRGREAAIRSFTDHVTHELKTPITALQGAAEMLEEAESLGPSDRRLVGTVAAAAVRMDRLLSELRRVAVLREGDFRGVARLGEAVPGLRSNWPGLILEVEGGEVALPLSRDGLGIVLGQLLGNAQGAGAKRVRLSAELVEGGTALRVRDDGPGVEPGDRARIFDPFFTTRREAGGTGMGLHIVRTLIEAQGGCISLEDEAGGAAFRLKLPGTM
jgi:signal transduction histidine kinase